MTIRKGIPTAAAAALLVLVSIGCGAIGTASPRTVKSDDGLSQLVVPPGWRERTDLNDEADIQVGDLRNNAYLIVLSENKIDFDNITYMEHSRLTRDGFLESLGSGKVVNGPTSLTINGRQAVKYELQATVNGIKIVYYHVTVDGPKAFHQILAWTVPSMIEKNREAMDFLLNSFRENG